MLFELVNLLGVANLAFNLIAVTITQEKDIRFEGRDAVVEIAGKTLWWTKTADCRYSGVVTPYVRDWDEKVMRGEQEVIIPATPDKFEGHAILINKKACKGMADEQVFYYNDMPGRPPKEGKFWIPVIKFATYELAGTNKDHIPRWYPQVMAKIMKSAETNEVARTFLAESKESRLEVAEMVLGKGNVPVEVDTAPTAAATEAAPSAEPVAEAPAQ